MSQQPPQYSPNHTVVVKSGCGKVALVISLILLVIAATIALLFGGCFYVGAKGVSKAIEEAEVQRKERAAIIEKMEVLDFTMMPSGKASFKVKNGGTVDVKDIAIEVRFLAASGTSLGTGRQTVYEIVKAGETKQFQDVIFGYVPQEAKKFAASVHEAISITP